MPPKPDQSPEQSFPFFDGLTDSEVRWAAAELLTVRTQIAENEDLTRTFDESLKLLGFQAPSGPTADLPRPSLYGKMRSHPVAALLAQTPPSSPDEEVKYLVLRALVLAAAVAIRGWQRGEYLSPIENACRAVRKLAEKHSNPVDLPLYKPDIASAYQEIIKSDERRQKQNVKLSKRLEPIRILFRKFVEDLPEITRDQSARQLDVIPLAEDEEIGTVEEVRDTFSKSPDHTGLHAREFCDDRSRRSIFVKLPPAPKTSPISRAPGAHHRRNVQLSHQIIRSRQLHNCDHKRLSTEDAITLYGACLKYLARLQSDNELAEFCLFIALSLLTGRSVDRLKSLPLDKPNTTQTEAWVRIERKVYLAYRPEIARQKLHKSVLAVTEIGPGHEIFDKIFERKDTQHLFLPLPDELSRPLLAFHSPQKRQHELALDTPPTWTMARLRKQLKLRLAGPVTESRVANFLPSLLHHRGVDPLIAAYICGESPQHVAALHYTQIDSDTVTSTFRQTLESAGIEIPDIQSKPRTLGSAMYPRHQFVKNMFMKSKEDIVQGYPSRSAKSWIDHHNRVATYLYQILVLATGHRPVKTPFEDLFTFDLKAGFVIVSDKEGANTPIPRMIPLCPTAVDQVNNYLSHLRELAKALSVIDLSLKKKIQDAATGKAPLLFLIDEQGTCLPFDPSNLETYRIHENPLPLNWQRHMLRSYLTGKVRGELIDACVGHGQFGQQANSIHSGLPIADLVPVRHHIQNLFETLGIEAL